MEPANCGYCGWDCDECEVKVNYAMTADEFKLAMAKAAIMRINKEVRPNLGPVTDEKIDWLKKVVDAPDVLMFIKLV